MAEPDRFRLVPEAHLLLERDGRTLLLLRAGTGYEDGNYSLISGHLDGGETARVAICREALEEAGIEVAPEDLEFVHVVHRNTRGERLGLFFTARRWRGDVRNMEPDKCAGLHWVPLDDLPANIVPYVRVALVGWQNGVAYSEDGWH